MKYNKREIMKAAWAMFRNGSASFAECLNRAWQAAKVKASTVMSGTAKQIAYAADIISNTIARIESKIAENKNANEWKMAKANMLFYAPATAAEVIDFEKEMGWFNYMVYAVENKLFIEG